MPAKRAKKYNPMAGAKASAKAGLKNVAVYHSERDKGKRISCCTVNFKTANEIPTGSSMARVLVNMRFKWNIHLLAIGIDNDGRKYFKVDEVPVTKELHQHDLVEYLEWRHDDFVTKSFNKNHLTNKAWIAVPNGDSLTNEQIDNILTKQEGY